MKHLMSITAAVILSLPLYAETLHGISVYYT